ncbi:Hypothetical protein, putative [Bodo saltans]|uniref:Flavodoxin-like domain-containing protein n=1 Tax=Bodo saltans TaxID=75058 RepID=A0A0S4IRG7_BODSA|nr:Hypothetical protein, putative [Bodo saltans]|eukprot:CUG02006.1 Hypothetical protein, putative [Bodo saltans]
MLLEIFAALLVVFVSAYWFTKRSGPRDELKSECKLRVVIAFATQKGTARSFAHKLFSSVAASEFTKKLVVKVIDVADVDVDTMSASTDVFVFIVSTYTGGQPPPAASNFATLLADMSNDFRVSRDHFAKTRFAIFGLGDVVYGDNFNMFAKNVNEWVRGLGGRMIIPSVFASEQRSQGLFSTFSHSVVSWLEKSCANGVIDEVQSDEDPADDDAAADDLEDIVSDTKESKELMYPRLRNNLTKQGYQLIGTHSGVKLCRWTKSMLRGRGGCYKHTFYNISSYQCMEMTPSLACANKCVFCWRHHTNPVAKSFIWKHDEPEFLVDCSCRSPGDDQAKKKKNMVTNAQFPDRIQQLSPVTQLYVSIDAATKEELRKIDRPIFDDFWERMLDCVREIGLKHQRTVFRLTLVNEYNVTSLPEWAQLVHMGKPDFIEVKGVTFCGANDASDLTMKNVPFHHEVVKFCEALIEAIGGGEYEIACEHEHSCCMLIAKKQFKINGVWHTWIDYPKFFELIEYPKFFELIESGRTDFTSLEYAAPTPAWAIFQSQEHGFDPKEVRHRREKQEVITSGC